MQAYHNETVRLLTAVAYHNDPMVKFEAVRLLTVAAANGSLIHGHGCNQTEGDGCALSVLAKTHTYAEFDERYAIPEHICVLLMHTFDALPIEDARIYAVRFLQAIPVGADLTDFPARMTAEILRGKVLTPKPGSKLQAVLDAINKDDESRMTFLRHWFGRHISDDWVEVVLDQLRRSEGAALEFALAHLDGTLGGEHRSDLIQAIK